MSKVRAHLRSSLVRGYLQLRDRLAARLGSRDLAGEALHEMWIKLQDGPPDLNPVADADAYLYRAALNTASKLRFQHYRMLGTVEIDAILDLEDETPNPERVAIARSELARLKTSLAELTVRQRAVFMAIYAGGVSHEALAERFGVSVRLIQMELRHAILHCARRSGRRNFVRVERPTRL